jgi:hypothetical protein
MRLRTRLILTMVQADHHANLFMIYLLWARGPIQRPFQTAPQFCSLLFLQLPQSSRDILMVSLDHSIYFHNPRAFRADEWMLSEIESPWAGEGPGMPGDCGSKLSGPG